jgi:hypothetical protein
LCLNYMLNLYYCHKMPMKHFLHLNKLWTICHFMSIKPQMWHAYEDVLCVFWFDCVAFVVAIVVCTFFFLHVSTLWFVGPKFVQCLAIFHILLCVFASVAYLVLCGIDSAFLAFVIVIHFSHNIVASLCFCNVNHFIPTIVILRYDYKPVLSRIIRKLFMIRTCKPWTNLWIYS